MNKNVNSNCDFKATHTIYEIFFKFNNSDNYKIDLTSFLSVVFRSVGSGER